MTEPRQPSATERTTHTVSICISKTPDAPNGLVTAIRALGEGIMAEQRAASWSVARQADLVLLVQEKGQIRFTLQQLAFGQAHSALEVGDDANLIRAVMRRAVTFIQKLRLKPAEQLQVDAVERSIDVEMHDVNGLEAAPRLIVHPGVQRGSLDPNPATYSVDASATEILFK